MGQLRYFTTHLEQHHEGSSRNVRRKQTGEEVKGKFMKLPINPQSLCKMIPALFTPILCLNVGFLLKPDITRVIF